MGSLVKNVKKDIGIPIAVHCHNDFGLAVANSLSAIENGAEAVSCTVNGIGERAGNAPLEEMVMALKYLYGVDLGFKTEVLRELSEMVSRYSGIPVPGNKPVVGDNIFTHESGLHVSAVLRNPLTYEPFPPEEVGQRRRISFGKHSGLEAVKYKLREIGVRFSEGDARRVLEMIKRRREGGEEITEEILQGIVREVLHGSGR
jgi:methanogen homocitrate synthase